MRVRRLRVGIGLLGVGVLQKAFSCCLSAPCVPCREQVPAADSPVVSLFSNAHLWFFPGVSSALIRAIQLGAADFLLKPINAVVLRNKLVDVFSNVQPAAEATTPTVTVLCVDDQVVVRRTVQCVFAVNHACFELCGAPALCPGYPFQFSPPA